MWLGGILGGIRSEWTHNRQKVKVFGLVYPKGAWLLVILMHCKMLQSWYIYWQRMRSVDRYWLCLILWIFHIAESSSKDDTTRLPSIFPPIGRLKNEVAKNKPAGCQWFLQNTLPLSGFSRNTRHSSTNGLWSFAWYTCSPAAGRVGWEVVKLHI